MLHKTERLTRDQFTWLTYLMMGYYSYFINGLGPVMPFLRTELGVSYTVSSLHSSAFAVGMLLAGLGTDRIVRRFGRHWTFWNGALGMAAGVMLLILGHHPILTIGGAFLMGTIGSLLLVTIPAALSDRYGAQRAIALSEANVVASLCGGLAPVAIGFFVSIKLGWRAALVVAILALFVLRALFHRLPFPEPKPVSGPQAAGRLKLPGIYWLYWSILTLAVAVEFCIVLWSSTFLETARHLPRVEAAFIMSVFLGAMVVGRFIGSRLSQYIQGQELVLGSVGVSLAGFLLHWWASPTLLTMIGLFLAGLGVANLYPQILALAVGSAGSQTDMASARASLASGSAILLLPLLLGGLADQIGILYAYGLVVILLLLVGLGLLWVRYATNAATFAAPQEQAKFILTKQTPSV